jgi:hypothetical protein
LVDPTEGIGEGGQVNADFVNLWNAGAWPLAETGENVIVSQGVPEVSFPLAEKGRSCMYVSRRPDHGKTPRGHDWFAVCSVLFRQMVWKGFIAVAYSLVTRVSQDVGTLPRFQLVLVLRGPEQCSTTEASARNQAMV